MDRTPEFEVSVPADAPVGDALLVGLSNLGLAGLTTVDYLIEELDAEEIGHVGTLNVPDITPFANGAPRYPMRLYTVESAGLSVLVGELFVPAWAANEFTHAIADWSSDAGIEEVTALHGVPFPHGPDAHEVFYVATDAYRRRRLADADVQPLEGGVLDGVPGELVTRSLDDAAPPVGTLVTPGHPPGPDFGAALRFLDAAAELYGIDVDESGLRRRSDELQRHYAELASRMETLEAADQPYGSHDYPEDRMYM